VDKSALLAPVQSRPGARGYGLGGVHYAIDLGAPLAYRQPMHSVIETPTFDATAKAAGISEAERWVMIEAIASDPTIGDLIVGTGGARKVRFAGRGKGKSGGYRVVFYFGGDDIPVFLLLALSKGDRVNISQSERNALRAELTGVADAYREGVRRHVQGR
jgi:hypothetical protein